MHREDKYTDSQGHYDEEKARRDMAKDRVAKEEKEKEERQRRRHRSEEGGRGR